VKQNSWDWDERDLLELIKLGVQESLELDYKQCDSLQRTDTKKNEISKDVSAFANSAGGVLVYGVEEDGHVPTAIDAGFDPNEISKEWLEQVINSRIQRRIDGVRVNQVALVTASPGRVAYVVSVPASMRAPHQAADKRFYKRFNFECVPMEEYEIRDVANRSTAPVLDIEFAFRPGDDKAPLVPATPEYYAPLALAAVITNHVQAVAEYAVVDLHIDQRIKLEPPGADVKVYPAAQSIDVGGEKVTLNKLTLLWDRSKGLPLFAGISAELPTVPLRVSLPKDPKIFPLGYTIGSPGMETKNEWVFLTVRDGEATFIRPKISRDTSAKVAA
jgi:hypothetical protein